MVERVKYMYMYMVYMKSTFFLKSLNRLDLRMVNSTINIPHLYADSISAWSNQGSVLLSILNQYRLSGGNIQGFNARKVISDVNASFILQYIVSGR